MNDIKLTDGGLGTELRYRGVEVPSHVNSIWSAQAIIDAPNEIEKIHYDYIQAGADHITINNYALTQPILKRAKIQERLKDLTLQSIEIARNAIDRSNKKVVLMGSLPPLETSYRPDLILPEEEMYNKNKEIADILNNNVDQYLFADYSMAEENNPWQYWSFPTYPSHIDHVLISNELFDEYESSTSMCSTILIDDFLFNSWTNYDQYLSDHRPVGLSLKIN